MSPAGRGRKDFVNIPGGPVKDASGSVDRAFRGSTVGSQPPSARALGRADGGSMNVVAGVVALLLLCYLVVALLKPEKF